MIYSNLARNGFFNKIQSLGGKSRAKKYNSYKSEIFAEWERDFIVILNVREVFLINLI
jgi:hypothetical protein